MHRSSLKPVLFFDFDNTLTDGDILDQVIERFSPDERWRDWEHDWAEGRLPACECLRLQIENLRVGRKALFDYLTSVRIDPAFSDIAGWAAARKVEVIIVSDSFEPLIHHILDNNGIAPLPVFANALEFDADRLRPAFPYADPHCMRSANAKARHLLPYRGHRIVFAGDGHSDLDAALAADVVFAKSTLARELADRSVSFQPFETLASIFDLLQAEYAGARAPLLRLA
jgi:2,3-diketo-5-methylthio-1-phosphopentane phosphatase